MTFLTSFFFSSSSTASEEVEKLRTIVDQNATERQNAINAENALTNQLNKVILALGFHYFSNFDGS